MSERIPSARIIINSATRAAKCGACGARVGSVDHHAHLRLLPEYSALKPPKHAQAHYGVSNRNKARAARIEAQRRGANVTVRPERPHDPVTVDLRNAGTRWPLECHQCSAWNSLIFEVYRPATSPGADS